ncbi:TonB-dependent receptor [Granulicella sibirica]|uniref:Oar protein n=1 Tax=Granulicella sibirica TaxID=2479048 RepID=A0A4Q0SUF4_9BACT|nr:TonB-dependent receptor [Granulicella sibirica]RXH54673.1 Oar protein [Granulicella sibirica]
MNRTKQTYSDLPNRILKLSLVLTLGFTLSLAARAQSTFGSIRGASTDTTGAIVPATIITLHSVEENADRTTTTDDSGSFVLENLKPGHYTLRASHEGFSLTNLTGIALEARQDLRLAVTLNVAAEQTTVEVTSSADQINTENGTIGDSKDNTLITQLPLNNRAVTTSPLGALSLSANVQQDSQGNIALGGASSSMVNFSVDGISTANVRQNGALQDAYPSQEGIAGVKVTAFNNSAEFSQVGDVTFTTKSGGNRYHGSLFEYFQNSALDASPYGFNGKAAKNFNTFGGSLSGPVSIPHLYNGQNRTFFFADYEGNRRTLSVAQQFLVPTAAERGGDLSALGGPVIPASSINATAAALLQYYPLPNVAGNAGYNYENFQSTPARTDGADARLDQTINSKQSIYARVSRKNITADYPNPFLPNDSDSIHNRSLLVSHTYTLTPRLLNEFRFGITNVSTAVNFPIQGAAAITQLGLLGVDLSQHPLTNAFPTFNFNSGTNFEPIGRDKTGVTASHTLQFSDNLTFTAGKHTFKGGVDIRRLRYQDTELFLPSDDFGSFTFQPTFTGNAFGDFLEGTPTTIFFAVSSPDVSGRTTQSSFFAQDEWQLTSRLTVSYGLRYQLLPAFKEDIGDLANFDPATNSIIVPDALASNLPKQNLQASNLAFQQSFNACNLGYTSLPCTNYKTASQAGLPQGLREVYKGDFQPRISLAYRPFNDTKTVVRGGFGVYTMTNLGPLSFNNSGNPTSNLHTYTNTSGQPLIQFPNTKPATTGVTYGGGNLDQAVNPNFRDPQSNQYNLTIERELTNADTLRVSFVGMHSYRLNITEDLNQIHASTTPYNSAAAGTQGVYVDSRAPYQNWNELYTTVNGGKANYKALEIEASHHMAHGVYFDANYTLAKNQADNQGDVPSGFAGEVNYGIPIADRFNIPGAYGNLEGTRRNRFLLTGIVQLPFGAGRKFLNGGGITDRILGGWDLNTITLLSSGPWLTPSISPSADQSNTNVQNRGAFLRPDLVSNDFAAGRSRAQYFNLAAFAPTPTNAGRFGNAGVGILEGPGTKTVSLGVAKSFRVTEGTKIRFESTFTNVLNHTNFAPPATQIDNAGFGVLQAATTAENAGNRTGQFALRFDF